jgi:HPt (histidine-containing phosphotransfer) domain-containing protein
MVGLLFAHRLKGVRGNVGTKFLEKFDSEFEPLTKADVVPREFERELVVVYQAARLESYARSKVGFDGCILSLDSMPSRLFTR